MKKTFRTVFGLAVALALTACILSISATNTPAPVSASSDTPQETPAYREQEFNGYTFEVPEGCTVTSQSADTFTATYPDGSFGVSIKQLDSPGTNCNRATALGRGIAYNMHLKEASTEKVKINGLKGVLTKGVSGGVNYDILILPAGGRELTAMVVSVPKTDAFARQFLRTLRRK